jgi:hypothetical protein
LLKFSIVASGASSRTIIPCLSVVTGGNRKLGGSLDLTTFLNFPTLYLYPLTMIIFQIQLFILLHQSNFMLILLWTLFSFSLMHAHILACVLKHFFILMWNLERMSNKGYGSLLLLHHYLTAAKLCIVVLLLHISYRLRFEQLKI